MNIPDLNSKEYTYNLDESKIAKYPVTNRDTSKLLIYKYEISNDYFYNIDNYIQEKSLLIVNNTKVIKARLIFRKPTGATIEIFCLEPQYPIDYYKNFNSTSSCSWKCLIGNSKKWKDETLENKFFINNIEVNIKAEKKFVNNNFFIKFSWDSGHRFSEIIENIGNIPIPPYLNRESETSDNDTYQTLYSKIEGSVAAPTAGLHFTDNVFKKLHNKNINIKELTLHVGAGTFKPLESEKIINHIMHNEYYMVSRDLLNAIIDNKNQLITSGTTSTRALESLYWIAAKIHNKIDNPEVIEQWDAYNLKYKASSKEAINTIIGFMDKHKIDTIEGYTKLMIVPGYKFKFIEGIITNFHQPNSTLLLLIAAIVGNDWKKIYNFAINNNYRFLSYGDSSLLFCKNND